MTDLAAPTGASIGARELRARLDSGSIFQPGSWVEENIRAAAYDLRMAKDLIVVPERPRFPTGKLYPRGEERTKDVILEPGDIAFLSTMERFVLPWDVGARVGMKFSLAARGVLTLTGSFVDPGYGLFFDKTISSWAGYEDQRLHFLFANVGGGPVAFRPGKEAIASIEFFNVDEPLRKKETPSQGFLEIKDNLPDPHNLTGTGLVFFRNVVDMAGQIADIETALETVRKDLGGVSGRVETVATGTNQIVMFGIYLICITFIALFLTTIITAMNTAGWATKVQDLHNLVVGQPIGIAILILTTIGVAAIVLNTVKVLANVVRMFMK